jgi:uncharacterized iron-regulated protein
MKYTYYLLILIILLKTSFAFGKIKIYSTDDSSFISLTEFLAKTNQNDHYVLGEYHYNSAIHKAQAELIEKVVTHLNQKSHFTIGWEFLNYQDRQSVSQSLSKFYNSMISPQELMQILFPKSSDQTGNLKYMPIFNIAKKLNAEVIALNATRKVKRYITSGGLSNLPPEHQVPAMQLGSSHYFERFENVMRDHVPSSLLKNFYEAQCYTDSMMAYAYSLQARHQLRFTVVGSFHSDYGDGYSFELSRYTNSRIVNIKVVDESELSQTQREDLISVHPQYGAIADFIIFSMD